MNAIYKILPNNGRYDIPCNSGVCILIYTIPVNVVLPVAW